MAYDKEKLFKDSIALIEKHKLIFIEDIIAFLPCSKQTFYDHFPVNSDELDEIKTGIEKNRVTLKVSLRQKMFTSDRSAQTLALYKLICTPEERKMLSMTEVKFTQGGDEPLFDLGLLTREERAVWRKLYDKATGKVQTIDIDHEEIKEIGE